MSFSVFDWHQDILSALVQGTPPAGETFVRAGYRVVVGAVFVLQRSGEGWEPPDDRLNETLLALELYHRWVDEDPVLVLVERLEDIPAIPEGRVGILLGVEGGYALTHPLLLRSLYRMGVRLLGLTWNVDNLLAASCKTRRDYGLTHLGYRIVEEALSLGMLVDLAHASARTRRDFYEGFPEVPPLFSHGGVLPSPDDPRNLPESEMDRYREGLVGLAVGRIFFETTSWSLKDLATRWKEILQKYGRAVGVGTDFFGLSPETLPEDLQRWDAMPALVRALREQGIPDEALQGLFWDHSVAYVERFLRAVGSSSPGRRAS